MNNFEEIELRQPWNLFIDSIEIEVICSSGESEVLKKFDMLLAFLESVLFHGVKKMLKWK